MKRINTVSREEVEGRGSWRKTLGFWFFLMLAAASLLGCERAEVQCRAVGLCEPPPPAPWVLDVLFDDSQDSPFDRGNATALVQNALRAMVPSPGAIVRFWRMGSAVGSTTVFATVEVPRRLPGGARARHAREQRFVATQTAAILRQIEPMFMAERRRRAPLLESLTRIATTPAPHNLPRTVAVLSAANERSALGGDWACSYVSSTRSLTPRLLRAQVLPPGVLQGITVVFSNASLSPVRRPGCPSMTLARQAQIEATWRGLVRGAGGEVRFERGVAEFANNLPTPHGRGPQS